MWSGAGTLVGVLCATRTYRALSVIEKRGWRATRDAHKGPHHSSTPPASLQIIGRRSAYTGAILMGFIMDGLDAEAYDRNYSDRQLIARIIGYFRPKLRIMLIVAAL